MKKAIIVTSLIFVFASCEKTTEGISGRQTAAESDDAVTATSSFNFTNGKQGWTTQGGATSSPSAGGNLGGCVKGTDNTAGSTWYFAAPASLLTAIQTKSGNFMLKFDLKAPTTNNTNAPDIIIESPTRTIVLDIADDPSAAAWTSYSAALTATADWRLGTLAGAKATNLQIKATLKQITKLWIRGEFSNTTGNVGYLDNVSVATIVTP